MRRALVRYLLKWNSFSSSVNCLFVKFVRAELLLLFNNNELFTAVVGRPMENGIWLMDAIKFVVPKNRFRNEISQFSLDTLLFLYILYYFLTIFHVCANQNHKLFNLPKSEFGKTRQVASIWWLFSENSCSVVVNFVTEIEINIKYSFISILR